MTQLIVLLAGPQGTPYSNGLWKLQLKIPADYPRSPPKAAFRTRIWHPNVEEKTGGVCVDTLKRDWEERLTLRDVLVVGFIFSWMCGLWIAYGGGDC
jgi:ubiquitin-conjugating enzyme E2 S